MAETKKEGSTVAASLKGFSAPFGVRVVKKKKGKNNVNKPYGEPELFENAVSLAMLDGESLDEVVRKVANRWAVLDDKTGASIGTYDKRAKAWAKQRMLRQQKKGKRKRKASSSPSKPRAKAKTAPKSQKAPRPRSRIAKEHFLNALKERFSSLIKEGSMISYVFEQNPTSNDSLGWEKFISKLSRETVMADPKLKSILETMAQNEAKILEKSFLAFKKSMESAGPFVVKQSGVDQDENGDVVINFETKIQEEGGMSLPLAIKIDNGRPLLMFPEETRQQLNTSHNDHTKLFRAEAMHIQETVFDNMHDVVSVTKQRDAYLEQLREKIDDVMHSLNPLELAMIKNLLKYKYRG